jgi:NAD+ synthase (glutamine-hydrolysing)
MCNERESLFYDTSKIAVCQMDVKPLRLRENVSVMRDFCRQAAGRGAKMIVFPELCVTGYMVGDKWTQRDFCEDALSYNDDIRAFADEWGLTIIYGNLFVDGDHIGRDGRFLRYNAVYCVEPGGKTQVRFKTLLPNYRVFDDERYFTPGAGEQSTAHAVTLNSGMKIGLEICEDLWYEDYGEGQNITKHLAAEGARIIINISASPWNEGKEQSRHRRLARLAAAINAAGQGFENLYEQEDLRGFEADFFAEQGGGRRQGFVPCQGQQRSSAENRREKTREDFVRTCFERFIYCACVGVQNNGKNIILFDGGSAIYNAQGHLVASPLNAYESGWFFADESRIAPRGSLEKQQTDGIIRAYHWLFETTGYAPLVFGLSGGIDSSVSVTLAKMASESAKHPARIIGINMPSQYNSEKTKNFAKYTAEVLGVDYRIIPIEDIYTAAKRVFPGLSGLADENTQAKIRGTMILSVVSALENGVMINNGNKLEVALGYCTLYGDVNGAMAPLADLTKAEVFALARFLNDEAQKNGNPPPIPQGLIPDENYVFDMPPSAELADNQRDPMKFGYHDALLSAVRGYHQLSMCETLSLYLEGKLQDHLGISEVLWRKYNLDDPAVFVKDLEWFFSQMRRAVFKRIQSPPIVQLSRSAYGYDYRECQGDDAFTREYIALKERLKGG